MATEDLVQSLLRAAGTCATSVTVTKSDVVAQRCASAALDCIRAAEILTEMRHRGRVE